MCFYIFFFSWPNHINFCLKDMGDQNPNSPIQWATHPSAAESLSCKKWPLRVALASECMLLFSLSLFPSKQPSIQQLLFWFLSLSLSCSLPSSSSSPSSVKAMAFFLSCCLPAKKSCCCCWVQHTISSAAAAAVSVCAPLLQTRCSHTPSLLSPP